MAGQVLNVSKGGAQVEGPSDGCGSKHVRTYRSPNAGAPSESGDRSPRLVAVPSSPEAVDEDRPGRALLCGCEVVDCSDYERWQRQPIASTTFPGDDDRGVTTNHLEAVEIKIQCLTDAKTEHAEYEQQRTVLWAFGSGDELMEFVGI